MEDYRERFVEANADALANVQKDNVDSISDAHKNLAVLSDSIDKSYEQIQSIAKLLSSILTKLRDDISSAGDRTLENQDEFNENFAESMEDMKKIFQDKLSEYNNTFAELEEKINIVLEGMEKNTENYTNTLTLITESQKEMNSLTSKDVQLLEKLVKG